MLALVISDPVIIAGLAVITGFVGVVVPVTTLLFNYKREARLERVLSAEREAARVERREVAERLDRTAKIAAEKLDAIDAGVTQTLHLTNGATTILLQQLATLARMHANMTNNKVDEAAAVAAEKKLQEHEDQQTKLASLAKMATLPAPVPAPVEPAIKDGATISVHVESIAADLKSDLEKKL